MKSWKILASTYITFCGYFNMKAAKMRIMTPESILLVIWPPHKPPPLQFFIFYYLLVIKFNSFLLLKFGWTQVDHKIFFVEMRISLIVRSNVFKDIYITNVFKDIYITNEYFLWGIVLPITIHININIKKITNKNHH